MNYSPLGGKESDTTEVTTTDSHDEAHAHCGLDMFQTSLYTLYRFKLFSNNIISVVWERLLYPFTGEEAEAQRG